LIFPDNGSLKHRGRIADMIIYGVNPVRETLRAAIMPVERIILAPGRKGRDIEGIVERAAKRNIPVITGDRNEMASLAGTKSHQGIICIASDYPYADIDAIIKNDNPQLTGSFILILDGVEDPHNLGSIIRSAYCFGINGIIIPQDRSVSVTPTVIKVSSGAAQHLPVARVVNIARTIDYLKDRGFWIFGSDAHGQSDFAGLDYSGKVCLVMGSEGKGIRPLVRKKCDYIISLKMPGSFDSLNVSVAAGIMVYEISRIMRK
jgi:23S rRNA (guanosine2251-2'-O)-methyltransferase